MPEHHSKARNGAGQGSLIGGGDMQHETPEQINEVPFSMLQDIEEYAIMLKLSLILWMSQVK